MPVDLPEVLQTNHVMNHLLSNKSIQHIKIKIIINFCGLSRGVGNQSRHKPFVM